MKTEFMIDLVFRHKLLGDYYFGAKNLITGCYYVYYGDRSKSNISIHSDNLKKFKELNIELVDISLKGVA